MSITKLMGGIVFILTLFLFCFQWLKPKEEKNFPSQQPLEKPAVQNQDIQKKPVAIEKTAEAPLKSLSKDSDLPAEIDRMTRLFQPFPPLSPLVQTISFASSVPWLQGRPAYLGDYASHYQTSKHFISRSLHGSGDYFSQNVSRGDRFNVFRQDKEIEFHLVLDLSRLKLWLYAFDAKEDERMLLKCYPVSAGRLDATCASGCLTPLGVFSLGKEVAVYKEGTVGSYHGKPAEMVTIFGKRWIPFSEELAQCTGVAKGLGLHGIPWVRSEGSDSLTECRECIGKYSSEGCVRLLSEDMDELFAVIITKPSYIHIVKDFFEAQLPGSREFTDPRP